MMKIPELQWDTERDEPFLQLRPGFRITPSRIEDVEAKNAFWNTDDVYRAMPDNPKPFPLEKTEESVISAIKSAKPLIDDLKRGDRPVNGCPLDVVRRESDQAWVGMMTAYPCDATRPIPVPGDFDYSKPWTNGSFQLGYALVKEVRGQGLSTEMATVLLNGYLRPIMGLRAVGAETFDANAASRAVLRSLGFREIYRWDKKLPKEWGGGTRQHLAHVKDLV